MTSKITRIQPMVVEAHNETESWSRFRKRFEIASLSVDYTKNITEEDAEIKAATASQFKGAALLSSIGEEGMEIFYNFNIEVNDIRYETLIERFEDYFGGRENKTILRHRFLTLVQGEEESLSDFTTRATRCSKQCQLGELQDDMTVHIVIKGIKNEKLKSELLQGTEINMESLAIACAKYESAERTLEAFGRKEEEVSAVTRGRTTRESEACTSCHKTGHTWKTCRQVECFNCLQQGHIAPDCHNAMVCKVCSKEGHRASDCYNNNRGRGRGRGSYRGRGGNRGRGQGSKQSYQAAATEQQETEPQKEQGETKDSAAYYGHAAHYNSTASDESL